MAEVVLKLKDVLALHTTLVKIEDAPLSIEAAYGLALMKDDVQKHYEFYNEQWQKIMSKYADKDESGEIIFNDNYEFTVGKDHADEFRKDSEDLINLEVKLPYRELTLDSLRAAGLTITDLYNLRHLIKE